MYIAVKLLYNAVDLFMYYNVFMFEYMCRPQPGNVKNWMEIYDTPHSPPSFPLIAHRNANTILQTIHNIYVHKI